MTTLTRSTSGLVYRDDFSTDTIANYTQTATQWSISSGVLHHNTTGISNISKNDITTGNCVTAKINKTVFPLTFNFGITMDKPERYDWYFNGYSSQIESGSSKLYLYSRNNNSVPLGNTAYAATLPAQIRMYYTGTHITARVGTSTNLTGAVLSVADTTHSQGFSGGGWAYNNATETFDDLDIRTSHIVTCTNLPTGYFLKVSDGTTTAKAQESSGTAVVDAGTVLFPLATVQVYDADPDMTGILKEEVTNSTLTNMGGGDIFSYGTIIKIRTIGVPTERTYPVEVRTYPVLP